MSVSENDVALSRARRRISRWRRYGPALFAVEAMGVPSEWNEEKHEGVLDWQWEASLRLAADPRDPGGDPRDGRVSVRSGHGSGKTAFAAWSVIWFETCYFPTRIPCTAPTRHQLEDVLWPEISLWHHRLKEVNPELGALFRWGKERFALVEEPEASFAALRTARKENPEALQGYHMAKIGGGLLLIVDEASGVDEAIYESGEGSLSQSGAKVLMLSNPTRLQGYFYDSHHRMRPTWWSIHADSVNSPFQSQIFRDNAARRYGKESAYYKVRVLGEFPPSQSDTVIPLEIADSAKFRDVQCYGPIVWGVDCARFGMDRSALAKRWGNHQHGKVQSWSGKDTMQVSGLVYHEWQDTPPHERPVCIAVDVIGIGAGVADRLAELGLPVLAVNVAESASIKDRYVRLRDEIWWNSREWLERKNCRLEDDEDLIAELTCITYKHLSDGRILVESKEDAKKRGIESPDLADAWNLTFAFGSERIGKTQNEVPDVAEEAGG